ncbi:MAG: pirin family protein [Pseudomonadota bacterium]
MSDTAKDVDQIIKPREKDLGDGFVVRRVLPFHNRKMVGPFVFFDHFGPVSYAPGIGFDVRPHPHIGLATVTYLYEGAIRHRDTEGNDLVIRPGAVNWMTAGRGICHSERTPDEERANGQSMHGIQTWVALPKDYEDIAPDFVHHPAETLPRFDLGGADAQILAGTGYGHRSPVSFPWPIWYIGGSADDGAHFNVPASEAEERAFYLATGSAKIGQIDIEPGQMAVLTPGVDVDVSLKPGTRFMMCGGATMDGPRKIEWNFVASDQAKIDAAKADWTDSIQRDWKGTIFQLPEGETEFIPGPWKT